MDTKTRFVLILTLALLAVEVRVDPVMRAKKE